MDNPWDKWEHEDFPVRGIGPRDLHVDLKEAGEGGCLIGFNVYEQTANHTGFVRWVKTGEGRDEFERYTVPLSDPLLPIIASVFRLSAYREREHAIPIMIVTADEWAAFEAQAKEHHGHHGHDD